MLFSNPLPHHITTSSSQSCLTILETTCKITHALQKEYRFAEIAQLVEHATENRGVVSSILSLGTTRLKLAGYKCGRSTVVVRLLAKEKVVGSNPIARSESPDGWQIWFPANHGLPAKFLYPATSPSGKARVCKTLIMGSNPIVASDKKKTGITPVFFDSASPTSRRRPGPAWRR
jgi:hypothetical protein